MFSNRINNAWSTRFWRKPKINIFDLQIKNRCILHCDRVSMWLISGRRVTYKNQASLGIIASINCVNLSVWKSLIIFLCQLFGQTFWFSALLGSINQQRWSIALVWGITYNKGHNFRGLNQPQQLLTRLQVSTRTQPLLTFSKLCITHT